MSRANSFYTDPGDKAAIWVKLSESASLMEVMH